VLYNIGLSSQNLSFGLNLNVNYHKCYVKTLTKAWKRVRGESATKKSHSHSLECENVRDYEGMNPHTPKRIIALGVGVLTKSKIFRE
jgi:hypothetical protein